MPTINIEFTGGGPLDGQWREMPDTVQVFTCQMHILDGGEAIVQLPDEEYRRAGKYLRSTVNGREVMLWAGETKRG